MTTKLILIRHGITEWNKEGRYCGYKDVGLSSQGKAQVIKLRKRLKKISFDRNYCSDRKRALQTRAILFGNGFGQREPNPALPAGRHGLTARSDFVKVKGLREINFGVFEGLKHDEIVEKYPEVYKEWLVDPYKGRIPLAEPMQVFKKRVQGAIKKIIRSNCGKTIAVVCHGGVIAIFVSSILKSRDFWNYVPSPASLTTVEYKKGKFKIKKFNQIDNSSAFASVPTEMSLRALFAKQSFKKLRSLFRAKRGIQLQGCGFASASPRNRCRSSPACRHRQAVTRLLPRAKLLLKKSDG